MDINMVKLKSDGTLDKLKSRLVIRGDLQKNVEKDTWSPTASFRALKKVWPTRLIFVSEYDNLISLGLFFKPKQEVGYLSNFLHYMDLYSQNTNNIVEFHSDC
jgi:hypothetical protein